MKNVVMNNGRNVTMNADAHSMIERFHCDLHYRLIGRSFDWLIDWLILVLTFSFALPCTVCLPIFLSVIVLFALPVECHGYLFWPWWFKQYIYMLTHNGSHHQGRRNVHLTWVDRSGWLCRSKMEALDYPFLLPDTFSIFFFPWWTESQGFMQTLFHSCMLVYCVFVLWRGSIVVNIARVY